MKYILSTTFLALSLFGVTTQGFAQTASPITPAAQPALFDSTGATTLAGRKQFVETSLRDLYTKLSTLHTRVQIATTRLGNNGIDIARANTSLATAQVALFNAKISLDTFTAVVVDEKPATVLTLRTQAKNAEDNLKVARTAIIESLSTLQLTLLAQ